MCIRDRAGIIGGCVVGVLNPVIKDASGEVISKGATVLEPIGTVFVNLMFCVVVPMVFCSISSAIANMSSACLLYTSISPAWGLRRQTLSRRVP